MPVRPLSGPDCGPITLQCAPPAPHGGYPPPYPAGLTSTAPVTVSATWGRVITILEVPRHA